MNVSVQMNIKHLSMLLCCVKKSHLVLFVIHTYTLVKHTYICVHKLWKEQVCSLFLYHYHFLSKTSFLKHFLSCILFSLSFSHYFFSCQHITHSRSSLTETLCQLTFEIFPSSFPFDFHCIFHSIFIIYLIIL